MGDRYVLEAMLEHDLSIGGEPTGHTILRKYASTGDGILTAIMLTEEVVESRHSLSQLAQPVPMLPQAVLTVPVNDKAAAMRDPQVLALVGEIREALGDGGRILLRESGTEPAVRVMVECDDRRRCESLTAAVEQKLRERGFSSRG